MSYQYFSAKQVGQWVPTAVRRVCLFASHEEGGALSVSNMQYANTLAEHFDLVLYLSTFRNTEVPEAYFRTNVVCIGCPNQLLDFGMWFRVLKELLPLRPALEQVALVNDSCTLLHPTRLLQLLGSAPMLCPVGGGVWGLTDSHEVIYHLQSYFLLFVGARAIAKLRAFVEDSQIHLDTALERWPVILKYEVGLSQFLMRQQVALVPQFRVEQTQVLAQAQHHEINQSLHLWETLLTGLGMPLVKHRKVVTDKVRMVTF